VLQKVFCCPRISFQRRLKPAPRFLPPTRPFLSRHQPSESSEKAPELFVYFKLSSSVPYPQYRTPQAVVPLTPLVFFNQKLLNLYRIVYIDIIGINFLIFPEAETDEDMLPFPISTVFTL